VSDRTLLVVGGGLAGAKAAIAARAGGFDGRVVLVGEEPHAPYERPPLSKAVLRGEAAPDSTLVAPAPAYEADGIELVTGDAVVALDPQARTARLQGGRGLGFDVAVLATGAHPRSLEVPGSQLEGVRTLRTLDDSQDLATAIRAAGRVAVVGTGWIGTEVAASARQAGAEVVLIGPSSTPLASVLGPEVGEVIRRLHADHGVELRLGTVATALEGRDAVEAVVLDDGRVEPADLVVVGIGALPSVGLAVDAGLAVDDGIVVDERLETAVPGIYAAGDVASAFHPRYGRHVRVEHWANALNQGTTAGTNAAGGAEVYDRLPYFFSDQFDLGLEYVGLADPGDDVIIRGDLEDREFLAFWHRGGQVTAAIAVNTWDVVDDLKAIVAGELLLPELEAVQALPHQ
jgi:3-phenylpropionate/trans-cinnamate dioxygenase ferredoxin reductase component